MNGLSVMNSFLYWGYEGEMKFIKFWRASFLISDESKISSLAISYFTVDKPLKSILFAKMNGKKCGKRAWKFFFLFVKWSRKAKVWRRGLKKIFFCFRVLKMKTDRQKNVEKGLEKFFFCFRVLEMKTDRQKNVEKGLKKFFLLFRLQKI